MVGSPGAAGRLQEAVAALRRIAPRASFLLLTGRIAAALPGEEGYEVQMAECYEALEAVPEAVPILFAGEVRGEGYG